MQKIEITGVYISVNNYMLFRIRRFHPCDVIIIKISFQISASQMKFATNSTFTSVLDLISLKQEAAHTIMWVKAASWGSEVQTERTNVRRVVELF